jgi:hypothetical protein
MEPLFEAKALVENEYALYNVYRLGPEQYKAELIITENSAVPPLAPPQLVVNKTNGQWLTEDQQFVELGTTIGVEIDVFNNGYGDMLGHIGVS